MLRTQQIFSGVTVPSLIPKYITSVRSGIWTFHHQTSIEAGERNEEKMGSLIQKPDFIQFCLWYRMAALIKNILYYCGRAIRETGQALDRAGCVLEGRAAYKEQLSRHRRIMPLKATWPQIGSKTFVAPSAAVIGSVIIGNQASIWYGAVLRGDVNSIRIGEKTVIGDRAVIHVSSYGITGPKVAPALIGDRVVISQGAVVHGCTIEDGAFIDIGATVLDGAVVHSEAVVSAGSLVTEGQRIPAGELWAGSPAKFIRTLTAEEKQAIKNSSDHYLQLAHLHDEFHSRSAEDQEKERQKLWSWEHRPEITPENTF